MFLKVFHISVFGLNLFSLWYDQMYVDLPYPSKEIEAMPLKARHLFLTVWCLTFQCLYFGVSFLNDVIGSAAAKKPPLIRKIRDVMFSVAFSLAIYVALAFWGIYAIDKDLIFPIEIASRIPVWMNQVMHTLIAPFILIEMLAANVKYPSRKLGLGLTLSICGVYTVWVHTVYFQTGVWAYPFLKEFNWPMRIAFFVVSALIGTFFYILGEKLNRLVTLKSVYYTNGTSNGVNGVKKKH